MEKSIRIACQGADFVPVESLIGFQGNLKDLTVENYRKLRTQIEDLGFSEPVSVWRSEQDGQLYILNGHQRVKTVMLMIEDGYQCPPLPISYVSASSFHEAKRKVLALTSQFGQITQEGLAEFLQETDISLQELEEKFSFFDLDVQKFIDSHVPSAPEPDLALPERTHSTSVKTMQLVFSEEDYERFIEAATVLMKLYEVDSVTDAVVRAVTDIYEQH